MSEVNNDPSQPILRKLIETTTRLAIPLNMTFELTYRCNVRCRHCYLPDHQDHGELTTEEVKKVLDELAALGCLYLTLTGGEILVRRDFFEIAAYAKKRGFALRLFTNGTLVDEEIADRFKELNPFTVDISFYGCKPETHDSVTQMPGSFEKSLNAVKLLKARGIRALLKLPLMNHNFPEYDGIIQLAEGLDVEYKFDPSIVPQNNGCEEPVALRISDDDLKTLFADKRLFPREGYEEVMGSVALPICEAGRNTANITPYGDVYPCLQLLLSAGNIREKSFREIWFDSPIMRQMREMTVEDLPECSKCKIAVWCNRCPGLALLEDGDLMGCSTRAKTIAEIREQIAREESK